MQNRLEVVMEYECPRCQKPVHKATKSAILFGGGLVGVMLASAFGSYECVHCGKIPRKEFPADVRSSMNKKSILLVGGAVVLLVVVIVLVVALSNI